VKVKAEAAASARRNPSTRENYNRINLGMTQAQVCEIMGSDGEEQSRAGAGGIEFVTVYWVNEDGRTRIRIDLENGRVTAMSHRGL
jgi:hypothetical protein